MRNTDFRGNEYGIGDTVLYPRMSGQSCEIQEGTVLDFKPFEDTRRVPNPHFDQYQPADWQHNPSTITEKFTNHKVKIQPTRSTRFGHWNNEERKPVWIQIPENVVKA